MQIPYGFIIVLLYVSSIPSLSVPIPSSFKTIMLICLPLSSIVAAIFINEWIGPGKRTWLMAIFTLPTVLGFALIAWVDTTGVRLFGYCTFPPS